MNILFILVSSILGYLIGSLPTAIVIGKATKGIDIREHGSKNAGATNAGRVLGRKYFYIVTIVDAIKCIIAILASYLLYILIFNKYNISSYDYTLALSLSGTTGMIGHCYPIFSEFKGGKGVATALGYLLLTTPLCAIGVIITFAITSLKTRYISLGSILGAVFTIIYTWLMYFFFKENYTIMSLNMVYSLGYCIVTTIFALVVIFKHNENIKRLINKNENKINF